MATQKEILLGKGLAWISQASNKEIMELCNCNPGRASNVRKEALRELGVEVEPRNAARSATATTATRQRATSPTVSLPGRVEDFMMDVVGLPLSLIQQHHIELVVLSDTATWNRRVARFGDDEVRMLEAYLGAPCTMSRRRDAARAMKQAAIDAEVQRKYAELYSSALADLADLHDAGSIMRRNGFRVFQDDFGLMRVTQNWPR